MGMLGIVILCEARMKSAKPLKPRQLNAIQLLAMGTPATQVAEKLEVSTMTLHRWRQLPEFEEKLSSVAHSGLEEIAKKMNATTITAIETLQEALCDMTVPINLRVKVALGVVHAMASVNGALEKSLKHRVADFDLRHRFSGPAFTYNSSGDICQQPIFNAQNDAEGEDGVVTV